MLALPLAKLSVAVDADPSEQQFTWQSETHNLTFVLDSYGARGSLQLLKVVQGTQVRQLIELERLITEGDVMMRSMQERGVQLKAEQLPVSALVRCPLLAIRWQLPDNKIRRAQFKFQTNNDYDTAYSHLEQLGLRMSSSGNGQSRSGSRTPSPERASTASSGPSHPLYPTQSVHGRLSCPPSRLADVSTRPYTATNAPTSLESELQGAAYVRPLSALASYRTGAVDPSRSLAGPLTPPVYFARPTSATSDILGRSTDTIDYPSHNRLLTNDEGSGAHLDSVMAVQRPTTADTMLPPRRKLPFQRSSSPMSPGREDTQPLSRPSTSLMGPPPLPSRVVGLRPGSGRTISQEMELPTLPKPTVIMSPEIQLPRTPMQGQGTQLQAGFASPDEKVVSQPALSASPASSPSSLKRGSSAAFPTPQPSSNLTQNSRQLLSRSSPVSPPTSDSAGHDPSIPTVTPFLGPADSGSLTGYSKQSDEARRAALNEFIFQNLENPEFITLVEDMETCWAKIALGTQ